MGTPSYTGQDTERFPRQWIEQVPNPLLTNNKIVFAESIFLLLVVWTTVAHAFGIVVVISTPWMVTVSTYELIASGEWIPHVLATLRRGIYGFIVAIIVGTTVGVVMGISTFWEKALQDYITFTLSIPSLFVVVFAAMWFGISDITPMVAGAVISFPYVAQNAYEGAANINRDLFTMSSAFGVSRQRVIRRVVVESIMPEWFAGARYAFGICWQITTLAELVAADNGVGHMIQRQMQILSLTGVLSWVILFTMILLIVEYGIFQRIEKRVFDWREQAEVGWV